MGDEAQPLVVDPDVAMLVGQLSIETHLLRQRVAELESYIEQSFTDSSPPEQPADT